MRWPTRPRWAGVLVAGGHPRREGLPFAHAADYPWRGQDLPSSRRTLCRYAHAPTTPEEPDGTRRFVPSGTAPGKTTLRASSIALSRLNRMAWRLAVYASPCQLPGNDARLACGCWLGFAARDSDPQSSKERFQLCVDHIASSSRELAWRNVSVHSVSLCALWYILSAPGPNRRYLPDHVA